MTEHKSVSINHTTKVVHGPGGPEMLHMNQWPKTGDKLLCGNGHHVMTWVGPNNPTELDQKMARNYAWPDGELVEPGTNPRCREPGCTKPQVMFVRKQEQGP